MYGLPKAIACTIVVVTNQLSTHLLCVLLLLLMASLRGFSVASKHNAHILGSLSHPAVTSEYRILEGSLHSHIHTKGYTQGLLRRNILRNGKGHTHAHTLACTHACTSVFTSFSTYMQSTSCVVH